MTEEPEVDVLATSGADGDAINWPERLECDEARKVSAIGESENIPPVECATVDLLTEGNVGLPFGEHGCALSIDIVARGWPAVPVFYGRRPATESLSSLRKQDREALFLSRWCEKLLLTRWRRIGRHHAMQVDHQA